MSSSSQTDHRSVTDGDGPSRMLPLPLLLRGASRSISSLLNLTFRGFVRSDLTLRLVRWDQIGFVRGVIIDIYEFAGS